MEEKEVQENAKEQVLSATESAATPNSTEVSQKRSRKPLVLTILVFILLLVLGILISSSKPAKIHRLTKFTQQVAKEYVNYSTSDLEKAEAKFDKLIRKIEKKDLNGKQTEKVQELKGECQGYFTQAKARIILQNHQNALDAAGPAVKDAVKSLMDEE